MRLCCNKHGSSHEEAVFSIGAQLHARGVVNQFPDAAATACTWPSRRGDTFQGPFFISDGADWCRLLRGLRAADPNWFASCLRTVVGLLNLGVRIPAERKIGGVVRCAGS